MAQLVERRVRNAKAVGSIPIISTKKGAPQGVTFFGGTRIEQGQATGTKADCQCG